MRSVLSIVFGIAVALAAISAGAPPVRALSCPETDPYDALKEADAAFVGWVRGPATELPWGDGLGNRFIFDVETWVKGDLGPTVTVGGFEWSDPVPGQRMGLVLRIDDRFAQTDDCAHIDPEVLLMVAGIGTEPESDAPAALLIGGAFGPARLMALDAEGRLVGFGPGDGSVQALAVCPGGRRVVEVAWDPREGEASVIAVRDVGTLELVREVRLAPEVEPPNGLVCRDEDGEDVLFNLPGLGIARLGAAPILLHAGDWRGAVLGTDVGLVIEQQTDPDELDRFGISAIDLTSGEVVRLTGPGEQPTEIMALTLSPDGAHAVLLEQPLLITRRQGADLQLFELPTARLIGRYHIPVPADCDSCWNEVLWIDATRILVRSQNWQDEAPVVDVRILSVPDLSVISEWSGWPASRSQVAGGLLLTLDMQVVYRLVASPLEGGDPVELRRIPTDSATTLVALPQFDDAAGSALLAAAAARPSPTPAGPSPLDVMPPSVGVPWHLVLGAVALVLLVAGGFIRRRRHC